MLAQFGATLDVLEWQSALAIVVSNIGKRAVAVNLNFYVSCWKLKIRPIVAVCESVGGVTDPDARLLGQRFRSNRSMRCNPWRWLWGLIPIFMLTWVALSLQRPVIEDDLTRRAQRVLDEAGFDWANVQFSGRDAIVSGRAPDEGTPRKAIQAVRSIWGVRVVRARTDLIQRVNDYSWSASLRNGQLIASGHVPNTEDRQSVLRIIKTNFPKYKVEDDMRLARGAPENGQWMSRIGFALKQLRYLKRGRVRIDERELRLSGEAVDFTSYKTLGSQLAGTLPAGLIRATNSVTPPEVDPFTWQVVLNNQQLLLDGYVPKEQLRESLFSRAKAAFPKLAIVDRMETARGAPRNWDKVALLALRELARMSVGRAELKSRDLTFVGQTSTEEKANEIRTALRNGIPETYKLVEDITFPKPVYPVASPYVTTIEWRDGTIELSGSAPSPDARQRLIASAKLAFPDVSLRNNLQLASGQVEGWQPCMQAGLDSLSQFTQGRIQLVGRRLELKSTTLDESLYSRVPPELRAAANRACDTEARIDLQLPEEPDLTWRAVRGGSEIVLEGEVPNAASKARLIDIASKLYTNGNVVDRMEIVESTPGNWLSVANLGLAMLAKLRSGEAVLHDQNLLVRGEAADTATATLVETALRRDIAKGYHGRQRIEVRSNAMIWSEEEVKRRNLEVQRRAEEEAKRLAKAKEERRLAEDEARRQQAAADAAEQRRREAEESLRRRKDAEARKKQAEEEAIRRAEVEVAAQQCEAELTDAATEGVILFDVSRASLKSQSGPTLDRLADLVRNCKTGIIEISGHTDSDGGDDFNLSLSQRRAESVLRYLARAGIPSDRLRATGYGETRPVVPNTTSRNKAKNRRIEFKVLID